MSLLPRFSNAARTGCVMIATAIALIGSGIGLAPASAMQIQRVVSPGGIEAWLVEEHAIPLVTLNFAFPGGSAQDPAGKEGLANLMTTLFDEGADDLASAAFQEKLEDNAVRMSFSDSRDVITGQLSTLGETRDIAFDLLRKALTRPRFDAEAVERMRRQAIAGLRRSAKDPEEIAADTFARISFPGHPYGRLTGGTEATLTAITPADLKAQHQRMFVRDGLKISVVGAIDAKTLATELDRIFGALPAKGRLDPVADTVPRTGLREAVTLPIPQTIIRFGLPGIKREDPDFIAAFVMNHILGGGSFSSWLYEEVREKRGLSYSVYSALGPLDHAGMFIGGAATRADRAKESLDLIRAQIRRMAEVGPSAEELAKAKAFITGSYALRFDTSDKIAGQLLAIQMDDLGIDYIERRNGLVDKVGLEDIRRVAKRLLTGEPTVVTVGPASGG